MNHSDSVGDKFVPSPFSQPDRNSSGGEFTPLRNLIQSPGWSIVVALFILTALTILAYSNSLDTPFVFDDRPNITENNHVKQLKTFTYEDLHRFFISRFKHGRWFAFFTFALNYCFGRLDPFGYHLVNIFIHLLAGIGVFAFTRLLVLKSSVLVSDTVLPSLSKEEKACLFAFLAGLFWTLHPVQTESVTYIVQRMSSLAGMFYFWGLYFYLRRLYAEGSAARWSWFLLVIICFFLGMGSKEIMATFPFAFFLVYWLFLPDREPFSGDGKWYHVLGVLLFFAGLAFYLLGGPAEIMERAREVTSGRELSNRHWSVLERVMTEWRIMFRYLAMILIPVPAMLNLDRDPIVSEGLLTPPSTLMALAGIVLLLLFAYIRRKTYPVVSFSIFWFALHMLITGTVLPLELMYDHRLYIPLFGPVVLLVYLMVNYSRFPVYGHLTAGLFIALGLTVSTYARNEDWSSWISLYRDVVEKAPRNPRG